MQDRASPPEIPNLTFRGFKYGRSEEPLGLLPLLYQGGASAEAKICRLLISRRFLGTPVLDRLPIIKDIYEHIEAKIAAGSPKSTIRTTIRRLREFYAWCDNLQKDVTRDSIQELFILWTDHLVDLYRNDKTITHIHAYQCAVAVAKIFNEILDLKKGLISITRIRRPNTGSGPPGKKTEKQNLEITFAFGRTLLDITNALTAEVIRGPLPIIINFHNGKVLEMWLKLRPPETLKTLSSQKPSTRALAAAKRSAWEADTSNRTRHHLINLRIECELLIFMSQTGINLEQAASLKISKFRYQSHINGYQVYRVYKGRRQGEVAFEIFSEYRAIFDKYLKWRSEILSEEENDLLFPFIKYGRLDLAPSFYATLSCCQKIDVKFICSRAIRKTRINWLLRRSLDPSLTAEMHAHTEMTLLKNYQQPDHQIAAIEISKFHAKHDPALIPPAPGLCIEANPKKNLNAPTEAPNPDCINSAGCLFCQHHRDIDSEDHLWSLASYKYLKILELARYRPAKNNLSIHPAKLAIDRINEKFNLLCESNENRRILISESLMRVKEGYFHPRWDGFIQLMEMRNENQPSPPQIGG